MASSTGSRRSYAGKLRWRRWARGIGRTPYAVRRRRFRIGILRHACGDVGTRRRRGERRSRTPGLSARAWATAPSSPSSCSLSTRTLPRCRRSRHGREAQLRRDGMESRVPNTRSEGPLGALTFERSPLATLRVASSGPTIGRTERFNGVPSRSCARAFRLAMGRAAPSAPASLGAESKGTCQPLVLVRGDFNPALMTAFGDDEFDVSKHGFVFPWRAFGSLKPVPKS